MLKLKAWFSKLFQSGSAQESILTATKRGFPALLYPGKKKALMDLARTFRNLGYKTEIY